MEVEKKVEMLIFLQDAPKRQGRRQREEVENRVCHVCGERAGKHSYYGGQVCPSCRAFFRRSVQSKWVAWKFNLLES